ncbi:MAG: HAD hydrolase family protein [Streptococcaceae bacterium]|nr:HAD hydrolase family protein [Streptococcaceae bacterium]MCH4176311.1 HAD hydrolase family protein [Streptococcaceae bacterium]
MTKKFGQIELPPIGMRIIKSAIGVLIGFLIYLLRGENGAPFYTALSVLWCMRAYDNESYGMALQRVIGTFIGGFYGLIMILLEFQFFKTEPDYIRFIVISLFIIPVIYTTILLNKKNASYFACVVFLSIVVLHLGEANPFLFVGDRIFDTLLGIGIALFLVRLHFPRHKRKDILIVCSVNDLLLFNNQGLAGYSKIELNRMIQNGMQFTICTVRTPADLIDRMSDIQFKLPIISMDGAVLYDMQENRYLKVRTISEETSKQIIDFLMTFQIQIFQNIIKEDVWLIYYGDFTNKAEEKIYQGHRRSPYRNYLYSAKPLLHETVYFLIIQKEIVVDQIVERLNAQSFSQDCRILTYTSDDYPGYKYLKVYQRDATKQNLIEELTDTLPVNQVITLGTIPDHYDVTIHSESAEETVKKIKNIFEPYLWEKRK